MGRLRDMWDRFYNMDHGCSCTRRGGKHSGKCQLVKFLRAKGRIESEIERLENLESLVARKAYEALGGEDI